MNEFNELDEMYREIILDHYRSPRNNQPIVKPTKEIESNNPFCGDEIKLQLNIEDGIVTEIGVLGRGCAISQASASLMGEALLEKNINDSLELYSSFRELLTGNLSEDQLDNLGDLLALEGVKKFPIRVKCALLSWSAFSDLIEA
tara:strand:+ start:248 stop:682 length:435 start_codon:yes stop_codon:yes gene_type:complete